MHNPINYNDNSSQLKVHLTHIYTAIKDSHFPTLTFQQNHDKVQTRDYELFTIYGNVIREGMDVQLLLPKQSSKLFCYHLNILRFLDKKTTT